MPDKYTHLTDSELEYNGGIDWKRYCRFLLSSVVAFAAAGAVFGGVLGVSFSILAFKTTREFVLMPLAPFLFTGGLTGAVSGTIFGCSYPVCQDGCDEIIDGFKRFIEG